MNMNFIYRSRNCPMLFAIWKLLYIKSYVSYPGQSETMYYSRENLQQYFRHFPGSELALILFPKEGSTFDLRKTCSLKLEKVREGPPSWNNFDPHHVLLFRPNSTSQFFEILHQVAIHLFKLRYRIWRPPMIFYWPIKLSRENKNWKDFIRYNLLNKVVTESKESIEINQNIYFHFELEPFNDAEEDDTILSSEQSVWEVYFINGYEDKIAVTREVNGVTIETWDSERVTRRNNLQNVKLSVVAPKFTNLKYQLKWEIINGTTDLTGGISLDMMRDFEYSMNFTGKVREGDWLTELVNGTWNGTTADLLSRRQLDLMIGQSVPILKRTEIMDYLQPTTENTLRAFVHQPPASTFNDIFTNPFEFRLRFALLVGLCLVFISIRLIAWILFKRGKIFKPEDARFNHEVAIWLVGTISQQGWYRPPTSTALRCAFLTTVVIALVCYAAYSAEIVSSLSVEPVPIQNLTDLFRSSLPIYAVDDSLTLQEIVRRLRSQMKTKLLNVSLDLGIYLIFQAPSSLISYTHRFHSERRNRNISGTVACSLYAFPLTGAPLPAAMGVLKHSPFREHFNHRVISMKEQGLLDRYRQKMNVVSGLHCASEMSTSYRSQLGLNDVSTAVIILSSGYFLCLALVFCENVYFCTVTRCKKDRQKIDFQWIE